MGGEKSIRKRSNPFIVEGRALTMDQIPESRKKALEEAVVKGYGGPCVDCGRRTANFCEKCFEVEGHSGALRENYKFAFLCNPCSEKWLHCHYCRCVPWATPPDNDGDPTNGYFEKKGSSSRRREDKASRTVKHNGGTFR